jgi:formate hydrogenlyase subunit 4
MRKMDEMEKSLTLKSIRVSWVFTVVFLLVWGIINYINGLGQTLPMVLFMLQIIVVLISQRILAMKTGDTVSRMYLITTILFTIAIIVIGGLLLIFLK